MRLLYTKPKLKYLSQESRIAFARQFRLMSQDEVSIRKLNKEKKINFNELEKIMDQKKGNRNEQISFNKEKIMSVIPIGLLNSDKRYIEKYIIKAINFYNQNKEDI